MKQDEIKKIFKECKLDIYDSNGAKTEAIPFSRLEKFVTLYNQYLLSKQKPSVSDEEIRKYANGNFGFDSDSTNLEHAFCSGAEWMRDKLSPQVVQSEVSEKQIDSFISDIWVYLADDFDKADRFYFKKCVNDFINSLTPPDAEAVMFAEWIYKNYISNGIGKYYHNNWNGDLDTLVNYTTQELFTLYKQGGK